MEAEKFGLLIQGFLSQNKYVSKSDESRNNNLNIIAIYRGKCQRKGLIEVKMVPSENWKYRRGGSCYSL